MADLTYRDLSAGDFDALHAIASDWSVVRQLGGWPWPADADFTQSRCRPFDGDGFVWAVCLDGQLCGTLGVMKGDLGYMFATRFHGQGIATRAAAKAIAHAFGTTGRDRLTGSTWYDNPASFRVLQKLGFVHWQTCYAQAKARKCPVLVHHHRLARTDWQRLRTAAQ